MRGRRPKTAQAGGGRGAAGVVEDRLGLQWSPQQIARWLLQEFPDREQMRVSHETIYMSLFVQGRGALRKELAHELRRGHATGDPRGVLPDQRPGPDPGRVPISERPAEVAGPGGARALGRATCCWARRRRCIATLVERQSRFVMLVKIAGRRTSDEVTAALAGEDPGPAR